MLKWEREATPVEWVLMYNTHVTGIVRRIRAGHHRIVYRAVTWSEHSSGRELVGYYTGFQDAGDALWNRFVDTTSPAFLATGPNTFVGKVAEPEQVDGIRPPTAWRQRQQAH